MDLELESISEQEEEAGALKAIFGDDFEDCRDKDSSELWRPLEMKLKLCPSMAENGCAAHVSATIHVICPRGYPKVKPEIEVEDPEGLSDKAVNELKDIVERTSLALVGHVMIYDIAQTVMDFLTENNHTPAGSFYDEMMSVKAADEAAKAKSVHDREQKSREHERNLALREHQRKQDALMMEARERRAEFKQRFSSGNTSFSESGGADMATSPPDKFEGLNPEVISTKIRGIRKTDSCTKEDHTCFRSLVFSKIDRKFIRSHCIAHQPGKTFFVAVDQVSGVPVLLTDWELKYNAKDLDVVKSVSSVEEDLNSLSRIQSDHLIPFIGANVVYELGCVHILTVHGYMSGTTASWHIERRLPAEYTQLRQYAVGVLTAFAYLHDHNVMHRDFRDCHIFVDQAGEVRLGGFVEDRKIKDLADAWAESSFLPDDDPAAAGPPVVTSYPNYVGRNGKKGDVHRFGIVFLSLRIGRIVTATFPAFPKDLIPDFKNFLESCLKKDEKGRWTAAELLDHPFLHAPAALPSLIPSKLSKGEQEAKLNDSMASSMMRPNRIFHSRNMRLHSEFHLLEHVGSGAFGKVIKARNRLDGNVYAIKKIELNPKSRHLNRKTLREVQLLSKLSHENVVRYYNSWIETTTDQTNKLDKTFSDGNDCSPSDEEDENGFEPVDVKSKASRWFAGPFDDDADAEDDDEDDDIFGHSIRRDKSSESSDGIVFEHSSSSATKENEESEEEESEGDGSEFREKNPTMHQFIYIQMEYCDKNTLRQAIDEGLHVDQTRVWRLFRQIVEGLLHIHQQGMIHRDLKPVNVFLDSEDNVKIGDFGLATHDVAFKTSVVPDHDSSLIICSPDGSEVTERHTAQIGTFFYIAPEIISPKAHHVVHYDQKVDIYSLGVVFFEMCSPPMPTAMERGLVLTDLRKKEIILPEYMTNKPLKQTQLLKRLLSHDPNERPTSAELLQSNWIPAVPIEESRMKEMVASALQNPSSRSYKDIVSLCFEQRLTDEAKLTAVTFELDEPRLLSRGGSGMVQYLLVKEAIKDVMVDVSRRHGALSLSTTLLVPQADPEFSFERPASVPLMDHSGTIVHLPYDLRTSYVRHVARHGLTQFKRYVIGKVFRKHKVFRIHPKELEEFDFDVLTPNESLLADAEVISMTSEILSRIPWEDEYHCEIHLNHTSLIFAILENFGIKQEKQDEMLSIISECKDKPFQAATEILVSQGLSQATAEDLWTSLKGVDSSKLNSLLKTLSKKIRDKSLSRLVKTSINELKTIIEYLEAFNVKLQIVIRPAMIHDAKDYSGVMFEFVGRLNTSKDTDTRRWEIVAAGGRYTGLMNRMMSLFEPVKPQEATSAGVGVSVSVDKLVVLAKISHRDCIEISQVIHKPRASVSIGVDAVVCSLGKPWDQMEKDIIKLANQLWSVGARVDVQYNVTKDFEALQDWCVQTGVPCLISLKESENPVLRVKNGLRFVEKKIPPSKTLPDVVMDVLTGLGQTMDRLPHSGSVDRMSSDSSARQAGPSGDFHSERGQPNDVHFYYYLSDKKKSGGRKITENQVLTLMSSVLKTLNPATSVHIFVVELDKPVLQSLAAEVDLRSLDEKTANEALDSIREKHGRNRDFVAQIMDKLLKIKEKAKSVVIIVNWPQKYYKVFM